MAPPRGRSRARRADRLGSSRRSSRGRSRSGSSRLENASQIAATVPGGPLFATRDGGVAVQPTPLMHTRLLSRCRSQQIEFDWKFAVSRFNQLLDSFVRSATEFCKGLWAMHRGDFTRHHVQQKQNGLAELLLVFPQAGLLLVPGHLPFEHFQVENVFQKVLGLLQHSGHFATGSLFLDNLSTLAFMLLGSVTIAERSVASIAPRPELVSRLMATVGGHRRALPVASRALRFGSAFGMS